MNKLAWFLHHLCLALKARGKTNREAIAIWHSAKAGARGACGRGPDSFLHRRDSGKPNRHARKSPYSQHTKLFTLTPSRPTAAQTASV